ncbi:MAG: inositol monophosphatase family protein [Alphaproteobacteria bacterium]
MKRYAQAKHPHFQPVRLKCLRDVADYFTEPDMSQSALLNVMTRAVLKSAKALVRDFGEVDKLQVSKKGAANFVTNADLRTEKLLMEELGHARPNFSFMTEESGSIPGKDTSKRFCIDPIDGTTNFMRAIPYFCVSVAAQELQSDGTWASVAGVIYDPIHDELFVAEKGHGATVNNYKLHVASRHEDALLSTSSPRKWREGYAQMVARLERVTDHGAVVRCSGSAALDLAYVAAGRLDGTWYHRLNSWDMAAGILLVREAGGVVAALDGGEVNMEAGSIVAASPVIYPTLKGLLAA